MRPSDSPTPFRLGSGSPRLRRTSRKMASSSRVSGCISKTPDSLGASVAAPRWPQDHEEMSGYPRLLDRPLHARPALTPRRVRPSLALSREAALLPSGRMTPSAPGKRYISGLTLAARMLVCLRIYQSVAREAARLTTGLPGSALTRWDLHPLDDSPNFQRYRHLLSNGPALPGRIHPP